MAVTNEGNQRRINSTVMTRLQPQTHQHDRRTSSVYGQISTSCSLLTTRKKHINQDSYFELLSDYVGL